jgi:hypothetical protein
MAIRRYYPLRDASIANLDTSLVGTKDISDSNVGASEILNLYHISGASPPEEARVLIQFPSASFPSGSQVYLKLFEAQHSESIPSDYTVVICPLEQSWTEGSGHDMDYYTDTGSVSWNSASLTAAWANPGAYGSASVSATFYFETGHEDLECDISEMSESMPYGLLIRTHPDLWIVDSYIKKFHSRQTHFPQKRPYLEVRWSDWTGSLSTEKHFRVQSAGPWSGSLIDEWTYTGSMAGTVVDVTSTLVDPTGALDVKVYNLKSAYYTNEVANLRVDIHPRDWIVATVAAALPDPTPAVVQDAYYRMVDDLTGEELVPFGTGSLKHTKLSFDDRGNYFTFYMECLPPERVCRIDLGWNISGSWEVRRGDDLKFRTR